MKYFGKEMEGIHPVGCIAMTWEDAERMAKRNEKDGWGFDMAKCLHFLANHMDADNVDEGDNEQLMSAIATKEMIEWRLEDANFHTFCGYLHNNEYAHALAWIAKEYCDMEVQ